MNNMQPEELRRFEFVGSNQYAKEQLHSFRERDSILRGLGVLEPASFGAVCERFAVAVCLETFHKLEKVVAFWVVELVTFKH